MSQTSTLVAEINLQPGRDQGYSACVPVRLGKLRINAFVDSGNTFANVISPQTMTALGIQVSQLEPVPQLSVGTAAAGRQMKILGQAPRIELQFGQLPTRFRIRPLVLQGLVHPLNLCGPFLRRVGIDQLHSQGVLRIHGKDVPMCTPRGTKSLPPSPEVCTLHVTTSSPKPQQYQPHGPSLEARSGSTAHRIEGKSRQVLPVQLEPPLPAGALVLLQPTMRSLLGDNPILQEVQSDGSLAVLVDNLEHEDVDLEPGALVGSVQEVTTAAAPDQTDESPPPAATTHKEFDALPQADKIKWLVTQFRLEDAPSLQRDPRLRKEVLRVLLQFSDIISIGGYGKTNLITHPINVHPGTEPIKMKHRPLNPVMEESLRQQIDRWLEQRVVEEADSPWSFPLVPVPKKNSKEIRWAVDYRKLNAVTKKDAFPLPNIADNLSRLAGSRVFSALDGAGAFHAVPVRRADREKTAFSSPFGQYQFVRMPFGLANAPATYSRLVAKALRHLPSSEVLCYLDDTAVHSPDAWSHLRTLRKVLAAFRAAGLQISPGKAQLFRDHIKYLGHEISAQGISVPPEYTSVVKEWPLPDTLKTLRAFLGKCGYYRRFIDDYATLSAPLVQYTQQDRQEEISRLHQDKAAVRAFRLMKEKLVSAPILAYPQFHGAPFILDTDFSVDPGAIGGVLSQVQDGQERVIAYGARRLLPRERNYASTKGELLAVIFFLQYYKYYLLHRPFVLRTDNRALTWIRSLESPTGMILRWLEILASFDFTVQHRKGTLHGNADSLSRAPHASFPTTEEEKVLVSDETAVVAAVQTPPGFTTEEIRDHQERDDNLQDVRRWKETPPSEAERRLLSPDQRRLLAFLPSLHQDPSSNLWSLQTSEEDTSKERLYVPSALRHRVIEAAHQFLGHAGTTATAHFCRKRFFMFRLIPEVHRTIQQCHACQVKSQKGPKQQDVHRPSVQAGAPFQVWSMDVMGPLRASSEGHRYLLTLKDVFSKWFEAIPLSNTTSEKVLRALQTLYARFGYPLQVHTDNATYFRSQAMREAFQRSGVRLTFTPTYNPQSNSVERTHRDLGTMLRVLCHQHTADWEEVLPAALLALRSAVHESTGVTPFACVYGKEPATPLDLISRVPDAPLAAHTYVRRLEDHQFRAHRAVQTQLGRALQRTSRRYGDEKDAIQPGEKVWLFTSKPATDRKLAIPYSGPWRVTKQQSGTLRTIRPEGDWCRQPKDITVSLNQLKRCYGEVRAPQRIDHDLQQLEDAEDNAEGPMGNTWVTDEAAAATQALNQDAGDVHAPSLREKTTSSATPQPAPRLFSRHRDVEDMAPSIVVHHERVSPSKLGATEVTPKSTLKTDSTTMTDPAVSAPPLPGQDQSGAWPAPKTQKSFDQSAQVRPCSSQVLESGEISLPPVQEELVDDVFVSSPAASAQATIPPSRSSSTSARAPSSVSAPVPSEPGLTTGTDSEEEAQTGVRQPARSNQGRKRKDASSDTSYSQGHRTASAAPSNYPKRPNRQHFVDSSEEEEVMPRRRRPRSSDSEYSLEHRVAVEDRHRYPKRHLKRYWWENYRM